MNSTKKAFKQLSMTRQFFFVRTTYDWAIFTFDAFYMTYVFKEAGTVQQVVYNILLTLLLTFVGFIIGSYFMNKVGVEKNLRLSFFLYIITGLLGIYMLRIGVASFLLISCVRGIAEGFFWASSNLVELGLPHDSRSRFYSISQGVNQVFFIVAPISLGYMLVQTHSLIPAYILFTLMCLIGVLIPYDFSINHKLSINKEMYLKVLRHPEFRNFAVTKIVISIMWMVEWLVSSIIPFVILGNELNMGVYLTFSSILSIIMTFITRNKTIHEKIEMGKPLIVLTTIANFLLVFNFGALFLYVMEIVHTLTASVLTPMEYDMNIRITNAIDSKDELGVELNIIQEAIYTLGRVLIGALILGIAAYGFSVISLLKILIVMLIVMRIANYIVSVIFLGKLKK